MRRAWARPVRFALAGLLALGGACSAYDRAALEPSAPRQDAPPPSLAGTSAGTGTSGDASSPPTTPTAVPDAGSSAPQAPEPAPRVCAELEGMTGCDARRYVAQEIPASILFLVDRSGSMACNPPPVQSVQACNTMPIAAEPSMPSRWQIAIAALKESLGMLQGSHASAGLTFFSVDNACGVDSTPSVGINPVSVPQRLAIAAALDGIAPRGGTPIVGAVILAYAHLHQEAKAPGNRYVVLLTDGEESCGFGGDDRDAADLARARRHLLEVEVQKAREANIRTFVIGAPGSEGARGFLSQLAFAGGTARKPDCVHGDPDAESGDCHHDLTTSSDFAQVLAQALGEIRGHALGCEFPTPNGRSRLINVQYGAEGGQAPVCLALDERPCNGGADGFQFAKHPDGSDDLSKVVLCGAACERVQRTPGLTIDVILGCEAVAVQ